MTGVILLGAARVPKCPSFFATYNSVLFPTLPFLTIRNSHEHWRRVTTPKRNSLSG